MAARLPARSPSRRIANLRLMHRIRAEAGGNDAEALARVFADPRIQDDGTLIGRIDAALEATEHRWLGAIATPLDVPALFELRGWSDVGYRRELRDPWPRSRDQSGHLLTALAMGLNPSRVRDRRFGLRVRDLAGAPRSWVDAEVALRFAIGHEKAPDPRPAEPLILLKIRRQLARATEDDVAAFRAALRGQRNRPDLDVPRAMVDLDAIEVGEGVGNSRADLLLSLAGWRLAELVVGGCLADTEALAGWIGRNLADGPPLAASSGAAVSRL